jgi:plasmid stabilization system protein ParE
LGQIVKYIAQDKPAAAEKFRDEVFAHINLLKKAPQLGRIVPEEGNPNIRELLHGNYRIIYRIRPRLKKIQVILTWHGKRLLRRSSYN